MSLIREINESIQFGDIEITTHNDDNSLEGTGTSKYMTVDASYYQLAEVFGPPILGKIGDDVAAEWIFEVIIPFVEEDNEDFDRIILTIYTRDRNYEDVNVWTMGAKSSDIVNNREAFLKAVDFVLHQFKVGS